MGEGARSTGGVHLTTLGYLRDGERVLMLERTKAPNLGQWIAPGGKLRPGESPEEGVVREVAEETGLAIASPPLRAVITQTSRDPSDRWMLFIFVARTWRGSLATSCPEGRLAWLPFADLCAASVPIPAADRIFTPWLFEPGDRLVSAKFWHAPDGAVERFERYA